MLIKVLERRVIFVKLETDRLVINEFNSIDKVAWSNIDGNAHVRKFIGGRTLSEKEVSDYIELSIRSYGENGFGRYAVRLRKTNKLIGMCGFLLEDYGIDFGYRYSLEYWGMGIGWVSCSMCY